MNFFSNIVKSISDFFNPPQDVSSSQSSQLTGLSGPLGGLVSVPVLQNPGQMLTIPGSGTAATTPAGFIPKPDSQLFNPADTGYITNPSGTKVPFAQPGASPVILNPAAPGAPASSVTNPSGGVSPTSLFSSAVSGGVRPITGSAPVLSQEAKGRGFSSQSEYERFLSQPHVGFGGQAGGSNPLGGNFGGTDLQSQGGASGLQGGTANFTGLLGAAGGASSVGLTLNSDASESQAATKKKETTVLPNGPVPTTAPAFKATLPAGPVNVADIQTNVDKISSIMSSGQPLTAATRDEFMGALNNYALALKGQVDKLNPTPAKPVVDTPEQLEAINKLPPQQQFDLRQNMDAFREKIGLPDLEASRIELMKQGRAMTDAYAKIADDIKNNPDLPKGLMARRLTELNKEQTTTLTNIKGQLDILNQQIDDANSQVNQEFQIAQFQQNQNEKQSDNARSQIQQLINTGAIGELDDADLANLGQLAGYNIEQLRAMRNAVTAKKEGSVTKKAYIDDNGTLNVVSIDENGKGTLVSSTPNVGKTKSDNGGIDSFINSGINATESAIGGQNTPDATSGGGWLDNFLSGLDIN